ncbi:MAG: hypothetical protein MUQ25_04335 [Candidatus Aminicenantes bacterium]|nr:hypothetical protein [Candidatus Aminicenantes bacterium]MCJ7485380.1 hypothetical protein [Candidatus Aminicenantes bacterium]
MKKAALLLIILGCLAGLSFGQNGKIGLGIVLGEPTGLSAKMWTGKTTAFDAGAAWSFVSGGFFQIHGDLLFHNFDLFQVDSGKMALYYGFGGRVKFADQTIVSVRVPIGISYQFEKTAIELFLEVVPMLDLVPATEVGVGGGAGFRYYF